MVPRRRAKPIPDGASLEEIRVRLARAVGSTEPGQGDQRPRQRAEALRPLVLPRATVIAVPDLLEIGVRPQVVDVLVRVVR